MSFPKYRYVNLESPADRALVESDPGGFLKINGDGVIFDEIQRSPELLSWIQVFTDERKANGKIILTGSHSFDLLSGVSQSLAGRTAILRLLPLSIQECVEAGLLGRESFMDTWLYTGFYPRVVDQGLNPSEAYDFYTETYLERDIRSLANIHDLRAFHRFLRLCAGRSGTILNKHSLATDAGISPHTVDAWISHLEASYLVRLVPPYYKNFNKRIVKSPKLFFLDAGLAAWLMGIREASQIETHPLRGQLFETMIASDIIKQSYNAGESGELFYFRDGNGNEVDLVLERGSRLEALEIKSSTSFRPEHLKGLEWFTALAGKETMRTLIYGGTESYLVRGCSIKPWSRLIPTDGVDADL
jgi:predicted AAA+ superfamily ATPase